MSSVRRLTLAFVCLSVVCAQRALGTEKVERLPTYVSNDGKEWNWRGIVESFHFRWLRKDRTCIRDIGDMDEVVFRFQGNMSVGQGKPFGRKMEVLWSRTEGMTQWTQVKAVLGTDSIIVGVEAALRVMCKGEVVYCLIPSALADDGIRGSSPYHTDFSTTIELVEHKKPSSWRNWASDAVAELTNHENMYDSLPLLAALVVISPLVRRVCLVLLYLFLGFDMDDDLTVNFGAGEPESGDPRRPKRIPSNAAVSTTLTSRRRR